MYIYVCLYMFVHRDMFKTKSKFNPRDKDLQNYRAIPKQFRKKTVEGKQSCMK